MFVSPSKMKLDRILLGRTINFDTERKMYGNLVVLATDSYDDIASVMTHMLFRPQQLYCMYTPRVVRPLNRKIVREDQAAVYASLRDKSSGRLKIGKPFVTSYAEKNLVYDMIPDFKETLALRENKQGFARYIAMKDFLEEFLPEAVSSVGYQKNYLIFPICDYSDKLGSVAKMGLFDTSVEDVTPMSLFLLTLRKGLADMSVYKMFDRIIFYNPNNEAVVVMDPSDPTLEKSINDYLLKISRLNNANKGEALEGDDVDSDGSDEADDSDKSDEAKEKIKNFVFTSVSKSLKIRAPETFDAATKDEGDIAAVVDKKIDGYLSKKENAGKSYDDLKTTIEADPDVKAAAIKYVETKKSNSQKLNQLAKGLEKEAKVIDDFEKSSASDKEEPEDKSKQTAGTAVKPSVLSALKSAAAAKYAAKDDDESKASPIAVDAESLLDDKEIDVDVANFDSRVRHSSLMALDEDYNTKQAKKDLMSILTHFSNSQFLPIAMDRINIVDSSDDFNKKMTLTAHYKADDGSSLGFTLDIPEVIDGRFIFINGNKMFIEKQLLRLPIVKTKPNVVEISTSYSKITVERTNEKVSRRNVRLLKMIKTAEPSAKGWTVLWGDNSVHNDRYVSDFEYEELASSISSIDAPRYDIDLDRQRIMSKISAMDFPDGFFKDDSMDTPIAIEKNSSNVIHIKPDGAVYLAIPTKDGGSIASDNKAADCIQAFVLAALGLQNADIPSIGKSFVYSRAKMIEQFYPIFSLCGFMEGITSVLRRYGVKYTLSDKRDRTLLSNYVEIRFRDKYFYFLDNLKNTMLLNVLRLMETDQYDFRDFDTEDPYVNFFVNVLGYNSYARNTIKLHLSAMVDPITYDVQKDLKQPTDIVGMLLFANTLLTTNTCRSLNDARNYRIRGNEEIYAVLYKVLADAYKNYQNGRLNGHRGGLDLPKNALIKALTNQVNVNPASVLNPVLELESLSNCTAKGFNGVNLDKAYTMKMRAYDPSMIGFLSGNDTQFGGTAGMSRSISYDPKISTIRGYIPDVDKSSLSATNILSPAEMLASFVSAQSDAPRSAMQISQTKHTMPVVKAHKQLVGSGINKTMAFMISDDFCFKAKKNGVIKTIDTNKHIAILAYDDGTNDAIDLGDVLVKNSNSGFFIKEHFLIKYSQGERFNKGDVIAYNPSYFSGKGKDIDYMPGTLAKVALAASDGAFEDSTMVDETLSNECASYFTMMTSVALGPNATIYSTVHAGDKVESEDTLLEYSKSYLDPSTAEYMNNMKDVLGANAVNEISRDKILSRYSGSVVSVKVYYNMPLAELSPTLRKLISEYKGIQLDRSEFLTKYNVPHGGSVHIDTTNQMGTDSSGKSKVNGSQYQGVLIEYYVEILDPIGPGDKITYTSALKGVVSKVFAAGESPTSEYHSELPCNAVCTPTGILGRMTSDFFSYLYSNKVLVELGRMIKAIWDY